MYSVDYAYLSELVTDSRLTYAEIAKAGGVPLGTVNRILTEHPQSPSVASMAGIVAACGGSLDDLMGVRVHHPPVACKETHVASCDCAHCPRCASCPAVSAYASASAAADREMQLKDRWLRWIRTYAVAVSLIALGLAVVAVLALRAQA